MNIEELDKFIENHLNLQVRISYSAHHDFLIRHGLNNCQTVLDLGTGNGTFVKKLANDHPEINFVGTDKRLSLVVACNREQYKNFRAMKVDIFSRQNNFNYNIFDGVIMRYFLLHVDHSQKILDLFIKEAKRPSHFWIIDLDWSTITCHPHHPVFDKFLKLIRDFCSKISIHSEGGSRMPSMLKNSNFTNIVVEQIPFDAKKMRLSDFVLYLKQEIICYSKMQGRIDQDPETLEILKFLDEEVGTGKIEIIYGMILISAELK